CANLQTSQNNCGACGTRCGDRQTCTAGVCGCRTGLTSCTVNGNATCFDTQANPNACGGCPDGQTHVCGAGQECLAGACVAASTGCSGATPDACPAGGGGDRVGCVNRDTD